MYFIMTKATPNARAYRLDAESLAEAHFSTGAPAKKQTTASPISFEAPLKVAQASRRVIKPCKFVCMLPRVCIDYIYIYMVGPPPKERTSFCIKHLTRTVFCHRKARGNLQKPQQLPFEQSRLPYRFHRRWHSLNDREVCATWPTRDILCPAFQRFQSFRAAVRSLPQTGKAWREKDLTTCRWEQCFEKQNI